MVQATKGSPDCLAPHEARSLKNVNEMRRAFISMAGLRSPGGPISKLFRRESGRNEAGNLISGPEALLITSHLESILWFCAMPD